MATDTKVWQGAKALRRMLVPVGDLEPFPGNPRRGDVSLVRESLERFGQTRPILVDATDGKRIIAGHHVRLAAIEAGWTHVAAQPAEFADEAEARAYLLADNRIPDLADYEKKELLTMLEELEALATWTGTGYQPDDVEDLRFELDRIAELAAQDFHGGASEDEETLALRAQLRAEAAITREVVLVMDEETYERFGVLVRILRKEYGLTGVTDTIFRAVETEAKRVNQGGE